MNRLILTILSLGLLTSFGAQAERATYGEVRLNDLARYQWDHRYPSLKQAMVCNVNGPDGFLSVRSGPSTGYSVERSLNRLAILTVDTGSIQGDWIRVETAYRSHTKNGWPLRESKSLHVYGWAHVDYMCAFEFQSTSISTLCGTVVDDGAQGEIVHSSGRKLSVPWMSLDERYDHLIDQLRVGTWRCVSGQVHNGEFTTLTKVTGCGSQTRSNPPCVNRPLRASDPANLRVCRRSPR